MTTYLGEKAVGIGTVKANMNVGKVITDEKTVLGDGFTEPLAVNTLLFATSESVAASAEAVRTEFDSKLKAVEDDVATKQDQLTAGEGIKIENNVISATGGGSVSVVHDDTLAGAGTSANPLGLSESVKDEIAGKASKETTKLLTTAVNDINTVLADKQDKLTAGENITIEDGVISATGGGGASLPDQTDNAGKFLMTDGATVSWGNALVNTAKNQDYSLCVLGNDISYGQSFNVLLGMSAQAKDFSVANATAVGAFSLANNSSVAIGNSARCKGKYAAQIGSGDNDTDYTLKFRDFEVLSADGTIPLERLTKVTEQIGDISTALTAILGE